MLLRRTHRLAALSSRILSILAGMTFALNSMASDIELPILKKTKLLQCAQTQPVAKEILSQFWEIQNNDLLLPVDETGSAELSAATLDIILRTLVDTAERYPELRNQVERTMLQWNYCDVFEDGVFYDLKYKNDQTERVMASYIAPDGWQGFKSLGFLGETGHRFVPEIISLDQNNLRVDFEQLFHRIYREQCFPHPDNAKLFDITEFGLPENLPPAVVGENTQYPHYWESECIYPREAPTLQTQLVIEAVAALVPVLDTVVSLAELPQLVPGLATKIFLSPVEQVVPEIQSIIKIEVTELMVPVLSSRVEFDQITPRFFVKPAAKLAKKPLVIASAGGSVGGYGGGGVAPTIITKPAVVQSVVRKVARPPVIQTQSAVIADKNTPLLERLLSSLHNGSNVLIIEKIQLTVNEYNGNVDTAISSSDVGASTLSPTFDKSVPKPEVVQSAQLATPKKKAQVKSKLVSPQSVKVPALESMLVVSSAGSALRPKVVVINKPHVPLANVPGLKTQLVVKAKTGKSVKKSDKPKKKSVQSIKKQVTKSAQSDSSIFIYQPFKDNKPDSNEKSVAQLLKEYADYELRRKAGRPKKKVVNTEIKKTPEPVSKNNYFQAVPALLTKVGIKSADRPLSVSKKTKKGSSTGVVLTSLTSKPENSTSFISDQTDETNKSKSTTPEKKPIGLAGSVYLKKSLGNGKWGIGGSINRKIIKDDFWFARVGWSYSLEEDQDPFSYSWGIGYSDWHAGTFSAQLNNWGPIKMGEGLALDKAIASFGYSVKSEILKKYRLSLSGALNIPIDGNSSAALNTRWSPIENWYINASVSQPLEGDGDPKWSYGFGYSDWRPNKFNLQYSNYGPNDLFDHNYRKNGTWSLSYNYKF